MQSCRIFTRIVVLGLALLAAIIYFCGCSDRTAEVVVDRRDITAYAVLDGTVAVPPAADAKILAPYDAPVEKILVTVGKAVKQGDVIMQLSAPQDQAYYQQARQRVQQARADLQQARQQWQSSLRAAQQELAQARAAERTARTQAQRPADEPGASIAVTERGNPELFAAIARRKEAQQKVLDIEAQMERALVLYQQQLAVAQQQFQDAQAGLKGAMVRTPISGTVLAVNVQIGEQAKRDPAKPVARVVNLDALTVNAEVDEDLLESIEHGDPVTVTVEDVPKVEFSGTVRQIYSRRVGLLKNAEHVVVVDFRNVKGQAKPGMSAIARVVLGRAEDVLALPVEAIYDHSGRKAVKIKQGDKWNTRVVETGLSDGKYIEIKSGLKAGDTVLLNP